MLPEPFRAMDLDDDLAWLAVADWLEEHGDADRAELLRLSRSLRDGLRARGRKAHEARLMELLAAGVEPCVATFTNDAGIEFVYVPAGAFLMGSRSRGGHVDDEGPQREVRLSRGFFLGRYAVTQDQYAAVTGKRPSYFAEGGGGAALVEGLDTGRFPVESVSHVQAVAFCRRLGRGRRPSPAYRLPTEAEWEYACRGGPVGRVFHYGATLSSLQANMDGNCPYGRARRGPYLERPCPVGQYRPNAFGLYDMHGNVREWCHDHYESGYYASAPNVDPPGPGGEGSYRVIRGGSWDSTGHSCRSAYRYLDTVGSRTTETGFRVAFAAPSQAAD